MDLQELLDLQGGVVTRAQALGTRLSERQLRGPDRQLVRLRQGVYADGALLRDDCGDSDGRLAVRTALRVAAHRLVTGVDLVAVGETGALIHGLPLLGRPSARLRLAERKDERPQHHGASRTMTEDDVVIVLGVPVASLSVTGVDVARARGFRAGVVTCDGVLARGIPREQLEAAAAACERWPGARRASRAVEFADGRSESALESIGRVGFADQGLPAPDLQTTLGDESGIFGRVDHYWGEHRTIAEADGELKYQEPADLFAEKRREDRFRDAGFQVVRYTWDEAYWRSDLIAARMRRAFARNARQRAA
jgi:hypothetical protein